MVLTADFSFAKLSSDYVRMIFSLAFATLANIKAVFFAMLPYMTIVGVFGMFVIWNGGVVLGKCLLLRRSFPC